jgi:hypothetical protein
MLKVFISYTHVDEDFRKQLGAQLSPFIRNGSLQVWHDRKLLAGDELDSSITAKLEECDLFLALVSPEFIESNYCFDRELARARERHNEKTMRLLPVILRACQWHHVPALGSLLATPKDGKPVASWSNRDEALSDVAGEIGRIVAAGQATTGAVVQAVPLSQSSVIGTLLEHKATNRRLATLGLSMPKRPPTDRDRDTFRLASFEEIYSIFDASINEAMAKGEVEGQIRRLDANRFCAVLYLEGRKMSAVTIHTGARGLGGNGISYVNQEDADTNTSNGWYTIEDKDGDFFFKANVFSSSGNGERQLTVTEVASEIWSSLVSPLGQRRR